MDGGRHTGKSVESSHWSSVVGQSPANVVFAGLFYANDQRRLYLELSLE